MDDGLLTNQLNFNWNGHKMTFISCDVCSELCDSIDEEIEAKLLGGEELCVLKMEVTLR